MRVGVCASAELKMRVGARASAELKMRVGVLCCAAMEDGALVRSPRCLFMHQTDVA
jgi:hypothetical protein